MISFISKKAALENLLWPLTELTWQQEPWFPSKGLSLSAEFMAQRGWTFTHHDLLPRQGRGWKKGQRLSPQVCPSSTRQKFLLYPRFKIKKKKKRWKKMNSLWSKDFSLLTTSLRHPGPRSMRRVRSPHGGGDQWLTRIPSCIPYIIVLHHLVLFHVYLCFSPNPFLPANPDLHTHRNSHLSTLTLMSHLGKLTLWEFSLMQSSHHPSHSSTPWVAHEIYIDCVSFWARFMPLLTIPPSQTEHQYLNFVPQYLTCFHISLAWASKM